MTTHFLWLAPALALSLPLSARAQRDPADAKAPAPALRYPSAFSDYKPWQDVKRGDWRQLNDNVRPANKGAGSHGHMHHGASAPSTPQAPASAPAPGHRGHHMHGGKP
jgi:hypothetical protein